MGIGIQERIEEGKTPKFEVMLDSTDGLVVDMFVADALKQHIQKNWPLQVENHFRAGSHRGRLDAAPSDALQNGQYQDFIDDVHLFVKGAVNDSENAKAKAELNELLTAHMGQWTKESEPHEEISD